MIRSRNKHLEKYIEISAGQAQRNTIYYSEVMGYHISVRVSDVWRWLHLGTLEVYIESTQIVVRVAIPGEYELAVANDDIKL